MALGKLLDPLESQFSLLWNGDNNTKGPELGPATSSGPASQ